MRLRMHGVPMPHEGPPAQRRTSTRLTVVVVALVVLAMAGWWRPRSGSEQGTHSASPPSGVHSGGELGVAINSDPQSFNPYAGRSDSTRELLSQLVHARLVRVDRRTGAAEPWLAETWEHSSDFLTWTLKLRRDVRFSDGVAFSSRDVLFAFEAIRDKGTASAIKEALEIGGRPIEVTAPDAGTVVLRFPTAFGPGLSLLDNLPILPAHILEPALRAGTLKDAWSVSTDPSQLPGLGPFRIDSYTPGERVTLSRNPYYWRQDARGTRLPYLDRLRLELVRDQETEILRLSAGQLDLLSKEIRAEDYARVKALAERGTLQFVDAGVGLDTNMLWFNLAPAAYAGDLRKPWLQSEDFRSALSAAVDRQALVDSVLLGAGVPICGPVSPGNLRWFAAVPCPPYDPDSARRTLRDRLGLADTNGDGLLEDRSGRPVRFSILTQQGDTVRLRSVGVIQEHLRLIGVTVDIVALDPSALIARFGEGQYDAIYFGAEASSYDPAHNLDFWRSSGDFHLWNPGQRQPGTAWEAQIDALMTRQVASVDLAERRELFARVQRTFVEHMPVLYFAAARVTVAMSSRVRNAQPMPLKPTVLWNADSLAVSQ
jgi:peptide/nickel transport system substrate-binding protein